MFFDRDHIEDAQALVVSDRELLAGLDQESVGRLTDLLSKSRVEPVPEHCILRSGTRPTPPSQSDENHLRVLATLAASGLEAVRCGSYARAREIEGASACRHGKRTIRGSRWPSRTGAAIGGRRPSLGGCELRTSWTRRSTSRVGETERRP